MSAVNADIGFIGTGTIASALINGICSSGGFGGSVYVSDTNKTNMLRLRETYPDFMVLAESNQEVIDRAEIVFPTVSPAVLREIAPELKFHEKNRVVHIAAGIKLQEANPWFKPAHSITRAVPLPFAAMRSGPVVLYSDDLLIEQLFSLVGSVVKVRTERELEILAVITGMMVSYYGLVGAVVDWSVSKGIDFRSALDYTTFMNEALSVLMRNECTEDMEIFMKGHAVPGSMNEKGWNILKEANAYEPWQEALNRIGVHYGL